MDKKKKQEILQAIEQVKKLNAVIGTCSHEIEGKKDESCRCVVCGKNFGWFCPDSPDHVCHYPDKMGRNTVQLIDGQLHVLTSEQYKRCCAGYDDICVFCGEPDERK